MKQTYFLPIKIKENNIWISTFTGIIVNEEQFEQLLSVEWKLYGSTLRTNRDDKLMSLVEFLYGKGWRKKEKNSLDYSPFGVYNIEDRKREQILSTFQAIQEYMNATLQYNLEASTWKTIGKYTIWFDEKDWHYVDMFPWNIVEKQNKVYITYLRRLDNNKDKPMMMNLPRLVLGLQDVQTGESSPLGHSHVVAYKDQVDKERKIINLSKSNIFSLPKGLSNAKEKRRSDAGVVRTHNGRYQARSYFNDGKPTYFGSHDTKEEAIEGRESYIRETISRGC